LAVQEAEIAGLDESDANLLRSVANQVAVAVHNAQLFAQVETALAEAQATQERYMERAWNKTRLGIHHHRYWHTRPGAEPLDESKQLTMLKSQQDQDMAGQSLLAPITLRDKQIGAVQLSTIAKNQSWTEGDLAVIEAVLDQVAQTAENLRLFEETRERAGRERMIRGIADKLRSASNLDRLVAIAAEELGQRFSATHAKLELGLQPEYLHNDNDKSNYAEGESL
jgi:GAF domain-containing protein